MNRGGRLWRGAELAKEDKVRELDGADVQSEYGSPRAVADSLNQRSSSSPYSWSSWRAPVCRQLPGPRASGLEQSVEWQRGSSICWGAVEGKRPGALTSMSRGMKCAWTTCKKSRLSEESSKNTQRVSAAWGLLQAEARGSLFPIPLLQLANSVSLGKLLSLSASQFPYLRPNSPTK